MEKSTGGAILTIIILIIFWFSSKPAEVSGKQSKEVLIKLKIITREDIDNETSESVIWRRRIRKLAHFGLFALVGTSAYLITGSLTKSISVVFLVGCLDEIHQYFVPGRGAQVKDVMIDVLGGTAGAILLKTLSK